MKKLKFLKIFLISFAVFCTISIGAVSSYMFFKNITGSAVLADTWESKLKEEMQAGTFEAPSQITDESSPFKDYYKIEKELDLAWVAYQVNNNKKYDIKFFLANDIEDLSAHNWVPIGKDFGHYFQGTFDGQGHTISGLNISGYCGCAGLFGCVNASATIKNVVLSNPTITISSVKETNGCLRVGSVAAYFGSYLTFENVTVNNPNITVYAKYQFFYAGGAVGEFSYGRISKCYVLDGYISSNNSNSQSEVCLGGIVGFASNSTISDCYNSANVYAAIDPDNTDSTNYNIPCAGGIVGKLSSSASVLGCCNAGTINTKSKGYSYLGGICGYSAGTSITISNCLNMGTIEDVTSSLSKRIYKEDSNKAEEYGSDKYDSEDFSNYLTMDSGYRYRNGEKNTVCSSEGAKFNCDVFQNGYYSYNGYSYQTKQINDAAMVYRLHITNYEKDIIENKQSTNVVYNPKVNDFYGNKNTEQNYINRKYCAIAGGIIGYGGVRVCIEKCINSGKVSSNNTENMLNVQITYKIKNRQSILYDNIYGGQANNASWVCCAAIKYVIKYSESFCGSIFGGGTPIRIDNCYVNENICGKSECSFERSVSFRGMQTTNTSITLDKNLTNVKEVKTYTKISDLRGENFSYNSPDVVVYYGGSTMCNSMKFNLTESFDQNENFKVTFSTNDMTYATLNLMDFLPEEKGFLQWTTIVDKFQKNYTSIQTLTKSNLPSGYDEDTWAVDSTGLTNNGYPYLKAFFW